jgi:hypothetical protein
MHSGVRAPLAVAVLLAATAAAQAQPAGFRHSSFPGEGDRAAMGCSAETAACLIVRCEDDFTTGLYIETYREGGDAGRWRLMIDREEPIVLVATPTPSGMPYSARVQDTIAARAIERLKHGAVAFLEAEDGDDIGVQRIPLDGSLQSIHDALYYCAPRQPQQAVPAESALNSGPVAPIPLPPPLR